MFYLSSSRANDQQIFLIVSISVPFVTPLWLQMGEKKLEASFWDLAHITVLILCLHVCTLNVLLLSLTHVPARPKGVVLYELVGSQNL